MIDYKNIGDSQITKMQKRRNKPAVLTMADLIAIGLCMFTALYVAVRAY